MVSIIGVGTGTDMMTIKASERIAEAQVIIGASRIVEPYEETAAVVYREYDATRIKEIVTDNKNMNIAVLVSGDTGFYSLADSLAKELTDVEIIPGISSVNSFFAKLKMPWQDAALISVHGRNKNLVDTVRRNRKTFALTGNNTDEIADRLTAAGFENLAVYAGSNLDSESELIEKVTVAELKGRQYDKLTVLLIINEDYDASVRCGISDEEFIRGEVPMTKAEVRAGIISKLNIKPTDNCYDIGAGTGSVTVEMALAAWDGNVVAIEKKPEGIELINQNIRKFHVGNVYAVCGEATDVLMNADLPVCDVAFIGGSDGHLKEIMTILLKKNPEVRMVVSAIALETLQVAMESFKELGIETEIVQISVSKNRGISGLNLMMANNPVYIIKGL